MTVSRAIKITDVVLRDGLQDQDVMVATDDKILVARALVAAGLRELEVAAFVAAQRVPQMSDGGQVLAALATGAFAGIRICTIALNGRGVSRARDSQLDELRLVVSAGAGHSKANAGRTADTALDEYTEALGSAATHFETTGAVSTAFNDPFDGAVDPSEVVRIVGRFVDIGVSRVSLADTLGTAPTTQVLRTLEAVRAAFPELSLGLHLHDAHGQALDTVGAAIELGADQFDSALGGLGGCPFAPGAHGNLDTALLVEHCAAQGFHTGIDASGLQQALSVLRAALGRGTPVASPG